MIEGQNAGDDAKWLPDGEVDRIWSDGDRSTFHLRHQPGEIVDERGCHMGVGRQFTDRVAAIESIELRQFLCILATDCRYFAQQPGTFEGRSEAHTSELQPLSPTSYAALCLKKKNSPPPHSKDNKQHL